MVKKFHCFQWIVLCSLLLAVALSSNNSNSANDIVEIINNNRTQQKLPQLNISPGLGCIALQYALHCIGNCSINNTINCQPSEDDFTEVFAPNCGVELPTFGVISGYLLGCQHQHLSPLDAFSKVLVQDKKTLSLIKNRTHTEVGIGLVNTHKHKGPYFWCVLFSNSQTNTSYILNDFGQGIKQKKGCYSGINTPCNGGQKHPRMFHDIVWIFMLYFVVFQ